MFVEFLDFHVVDEGWQKGKWCLEFLVTELKGPERVECAYFETVKDLRDLLLRHHGID